MKSLLKVKVFLTVMLITACMQSTVVMSTSDMPQWVQSEPDLYPNFKYLSATGSAGNAEQAKARALSNLAKIFEVQIREVSTTTSDIQTHKVQGDESVEKRQRVASTVNLKTDKMVQGARIAEQWQNEDDLTFYALAVLDRAQAGNNIRTEMSRLDEETKFALDQHDQRNDALLKIADLHTASKLQDDRMTLQKTLKIIDVKGRGLASAYNLAELNERLQQSLRNLKVQSVVKQDDVGGLNAILQGAMSQAGFTVAGAADADYQISASIDAQDPIQQQDWYWLRATLKIELLSQDGATVIGYKSWPLKVSASSELQLDARMQKEADKKLKQQLLNSILEFAS